MNQSPNSAAYSFGISNLYAPIGAVQFTLVNWTPHIAAYIFGISNLYAPTGAVQFTLVNWTPHVAAYIFGVSNLYGELDSARRGIHIWRIKSVCSNWSGPIYISELDSASDRVLTFAHEHFFCAKKGCFDVLLHSTRWRR